MNSESRIQSQCFTWFWNKYPQYRGLLFHIPNGGKRTKVEAARLKAMGVVPGVPDLFLAIAGYGYYGLFIEVKKPGQIPGPDKKPDTHDLRQMKVMTKFIYWGYKCVYCDSLDLFKVIITNYLEYGEKS